MTSKKDKPKRYRNLKPAWKPGQAGNPQGRPPRDVQQRELLSQLADHGDEALATVIAVMRKARASAGDAVKLRAAQDVLDRLIGRPTQSLAASVIQRTMAHDGTLIEGSAIGAMSPLLQAAHAHFAEEEMRQLAAPKTKPAPEPSPPPPPAVIALPDESVVPSESAPPESTTRPPSVQIPEVPEPAPEASPSKPPDAAAFMALKAKEREAQQEERRKQLPGGQIPAKDWFQPDPREGPEIVRFTRIPGGRGIRRC